MKPEEISEFTGSVLFSAVWCGPCRALKQTLKKAGIEIPVIDVDTNAKWVKDVAEVRSVPTLVRYENGEEKERLSGEANIVNFVLDQNES